jgi:hypothetical protein
MLQPVAQEIKEWLAKPYREEGTALDWFLFIGLMTVATILWTRVIRRLVD